MDRTAPADREQIRRSPARARDSTMHGVAPLMIVTGPYAQKIGIHGGNGCFSPSFRANASIGRAIRLMMLNLGGGIAGIGSATIFATPLRYTACIGENVERTPWETLAVSKGCSAGDNEMSKEVQVAIAAVGG